MRRNARWNGIEEYLVLEYFREAARALDKKKGIYADEVGYNCIFLSAEDFKDALSTAINYFREEKGIDIASYLKFVDVGCGLGHKLLLARSYGLSTSGIEIRKPYAKKCRSLMKQFLGYFAKNIKVVNTDAMKFDGYGDFDIVYFYCPIRNHEVELQLEEKIASEVKVGAVVIGFMAESFVKGRKNFRRIGNAVYVKTGI